MGAPYVILDYLAWHYTRAFRDMLVVWFNFFWFVVHFFSLPTLVRTLFAPWKRMKEEYHKTNLEDFFGDLVVNILSRIVGALVRLAVIFLGLLVLFAMVFSFLGFAVFWVGAPLFLLVSLGTGVTLLF